jgi:hypothetical protein
MGGSVSDYTKSNEGEIGSQIVCLLGSTSGIYMDTPDLGLHGDKSESYQLLLIRDSLLLFQASFFFCRLGPQPSRPCGFLAQSH